MTANMDSAQSLSKEKILAINKQPMVRTFTHHMFLHAICSSDKYIGEKIIDLEIESSTTGLWNIEETNVKVSKKNNRVNVVADKYNSNMQTRIYRNCNEHDEMIIKISYQQFTCAFAYVGLVIENTEGTIFTLGNSCKTINPVDSYKERLFIKVNDEFVKITKQLSDETYPIWLKITKKNNEVTAFSSLDGKKWIMQACLPINWSVASELKIGIRSQMYERQWYNWLFTNYIQVVYNPESNNIQADYFNGIKKNLCFNYTNMFLDCIMEEIPVVEKYITSYTKFLKRNINNNRYIELNLNEFHIKGNSCYHKKNRYHPNLIYGYNNKEKYFLAMGIDDKGYPCFKKIAYKEMECATRQCPLLRRIVVFGYNPDVNIFKLNINTIIQFLKDYLSGNHSDRNIYFLFPEIPYFFGIGIYDVYGEEKYIDELLSDIRISYLIKEHKKIMLERLNFFMKKNLLRPEEYQELHPVCIKVLNTASLILNTVIKYNLTKKENLKDRIVNYLGLIKENEITVYSKLIDMIMKKQKILN